MSIRSMAVCSAFIAIILIGSGCTRTENKAAAPAKAPEFTLKDLSGKKVNLSEQRGKVVLIEFWATWCPPCVASIPSIEKLHRTYANKGVVIFAVSMDDESDLDHVRKFVKQKGITYTVLMGSEEVSTDYRVRVVPSLFLVDRNGMIAQQYLGADSEEAIEKDIQRLL